MGKYTVKTIWSRQQVITNIRSELRFTKEEAEVRKYCEVLTRSVGKLMNLYLSPNLRTL